MGRPFHPILAVALCALAAGCLSSGGDGSPNATTTPPGLGEGPIDELNPGFACPEWHNMTTFSSTCHDLTQLAAIHALPLDSLAYEVRLHFAEPQTCSKSIGFITETHSPHYTGIHWVDRGEGWEFAAAGGPASVVHVHGEAVNYPGRDDSGAPMPMQFTSNRTYEGDVGFMGAFVDLTAGSNPLVRHPHEFSFDCAGPFEVVSLKEGVAVALWQVGATSDGSSVVISSPVAGGTAATVTTGVSRSTTTSFNTTMVAGGFEIQPHATSGELRATFPGGPEAWQHDGRVRSWSDGPGNYGLNADHVSLGDQDWIFAAVAEYPVEWFAM